MTTLIIKGLLSVVNLLCDHGPVADLIDPEDLIDSHGIADMLGLANGRVVSVLRSRNSDFPQPTVDMGRGRCLLWLRQDVEAWARETGRA